MGYAFPRDLAEQVTARWRTFVARHDRPAPPLPLTANLQYVLETAFFASLAREEGRSLRFVLCCAPTTEILRDGSSELVPVVPFRQPRALSVDALRSLAPAVSPVNAAILVRFDEQASAPACEMAGLLNIGSHLAQARSGRSFYHRPAPYALIVDVRDAGEMHIYRGGIKLATLMSGHLHDQLAYSGLEFLPIGDILARGGDALRARITRPAHEPPRETSDFEWAALLNTILCIVNGVREHEHGGTVLLVAPGAERTLPVRIKFDVEDYQALVSRCFVDFINARHTLTSGEIENRTRTPIAGAPATSLLRDATFIAETDLADAADLTARLSAVDGALVISSDLRVIGFGAEIVADAARSVHAFEVKGHPLRGGAWTEIDSESFGMRHRSALRCVALAESTAAFVVSQDGTVTFMWKQDDRLFLKRNVNTANPNMVGA